MLCRVDISEQELTLRRSIAISILGVGIERYIKYFPESGEYRASQFILDHYQLRDHIKPYAGCLASDRRGYLLQFQREQHVGNVV